MSTIGPISSVAKEWLCCAFHRSSWPTICCEHFFSYYVRILFLSLFCFLIGIVFVHFRLYFNHFINFLSIYFDLSLALQHGSSELSSQSIRFIENNANVQKLAIEYDRGNLITLLSNGI